ncbi:hypothetical protein ABB02_01643 [Clostridiaceae bacterium JG1575]|nr:hypothetical protein ABB02_01643 [Clostridiaceae bacterium JG1575]
MKVRPEMKSIEEDMQPGRLSLEGYLGEDSRSLETIIREDEEVLKELGTTAKEMGRVMRRITLAGMEAEGEPIPFDGYEVEVSEYRGWIGCPFKDNRKAGKRITNVTSLETGEHFCWTDIGIHLVRDHGFFQGKGSSFRLDPAALAKFLRMSERTLAPLTEDE